MWLGDKQKTNLKFSDTLTQEMKTMSNQGDNDCESLLRRWRWVRLVRLLLRSVQCWRHLLVQQREDY
jgi:hypothetical protein